MKIMKSILSLLAGMLTGVLASYMVGPENRTAIKRKMLNFKKSNFF